MTDVVLRADEHFEGLREPVWSRFRARHGLFGRDRFEDAYAEWWTRELERAAQGRPSRAAAPAAFVAEAVHRVLIDEARARARGLGRDEKATLELVDLDDQRDVAHDDDTAAAAHYEAVAHRILALVRDRLTPRETQVFVWSYLYLQTSERTAAALGLSEPRVKKDRKKVATKVGAEVWSVLSGELSLCAAYGDKQLAAVFEVLTDHAEDCRECARALGGMRRGAVAAVAPIELLALGGAEPLDAFDALLAKLTAPLHRVAETAVSTPPGGRAAAVAALAAAAVGGGVAVEPPAQGRHVEAAARVAPAARARPVATVVVTPEPMATATATARPGPSRTRERRRRHVERAPVSASPSPTPVPTAVATPAAAPVAPAPAPATAPAAAAPPPGGEFGFEHP